MDGRTRSLEDDSVLKALRAYREALEAGEQPDRAALVARFPEIAADLDAVLDGLDFVHRASPRLREGALPGPLGDFEIKREIARGGMGVVYEAEQVSLGRRVALKTLPFVSALDEKHRLRFENEVLATARLEHAHIVPVHAVGCERGIHFYAMQYIAGMTLAEVIAALRRDETSKPVARLVAGGTVQSPEYCRACARLGAEAARALAYAHDQGVIHRDIKPANLILDEAGEVWITDFGLAAVRQSKAALTVTGDILGTGRYMSPEQWSAGRLPVDRRSDIYSLGATLYELVTLERAFPGESAKELWTAITTRDPPPPSRFNPACPPELAAILRIAMAKEPDERYRSADEFADDLGRFADERPIVARPSTFVRRSRTWTRGHRALFAAIVLVVLMSATAARLFARANKGAGRRPPPPVTTAELARRADRAYEEGYLSWERGDDEQALAFLRGSLEKHERVVKAEPRNAEQAEHLARDLFFLGRSLYRLERPKEALAHFNRYARAQRHAVAIANRSDDGVLGNALVERARVHRELGSRRAAVSDYRKGIRMIEQAAAAKRLHHSFWDALVVAHYELGSLLREMGRADDAVDQFRLAVQPLALSWTPMWQAWVLSECAEIRDPRQAVEIAEASLTSPYYTGKYARLKPLRLRVLGTALYRAGRYKEALDAVRRSMAGRTGGGGHWYVAAMALWKLGEKEQAKAMFDRRKTMRETRHWTLSLADLRRLRGEAAALLGS